MAKQKKDGIKATFIIERPIFQILDDFCEKTGRTKTKVVEMAIDDYIKRHSQETIYNRNDA